MGDLGWPGGIVWVGMGDLGWVGLGLGPGQSQLASHWLLAGCGSKGRWRPAQSVLAAVQRPPGCWRPAARNVNYVRCQAGQPVPGSFLNPFPQPWLISLPCGKGPGLLGRKPAVCARCSPHCSAQGELREGPQLAAHVPPSVQGCPGSGWVHLWVEKRE